MGRLRPIWTRDYGRRCVQRLLGKRGSHAKGKTLEAMLPLPLAAASDQVERQEGAASRGRRGQKNQPWFDHP